MFGLQGAEGPARLYSGAPARPTAISGEAAFPLDAIPDDVYGSDVSAYDRLHVMFAGEFIVALAGDPPPPRPPPTPHSKMFLRMMSRALLPSSRQM